MKRVFRRPSGAMLVAIAALIVALCGTAVAGGVLNKKKVKKISKNVADTQITARAPGLAVASAKTADAANNLTDQTQQIRAWARVDSDGSVLASKNVTSVVQDGDGRYCFDTPFTPNAAIATLDGDNANLNQQILTAINQNSLCPAGNRDVRVSTGTPGGDGTVDEGFFVYIN